MGTRRFRSRWLGNPAGFRVLLINIENDECHKNATSGKSLPFDSCENRYLPTNAIKATPPITRFIMFQWHPVYTVATVWTPGSVGTEAISKRICLFLGSYPRWVLAFLVWKWWREVFCHHHPNTQSGRKVLHNSGSKLTSTGFINCRSWIEVCFKFCKSVTENCASNWAKFGSFSAICFRYFSLVLCICVSLNTNY